MTIYGETDNENVGALWWRRQGVTSALHSKGEINSC